jgi:alanine racemase
VHTPTAILEIDLAALADNYRLLAGRAAGAAVAPAVKADAYGLGAAQVATALAAAGARTFYVAQLAEALELRSLLPSARLCVFNGCLPGEERDFVANSLVPVLNSLAQACLWQATARAAGRRLPAILHFDTGLTRLGIPPDEADSFVAGAGVLHGLSIEALMSHLACSDEPGHPMNAVQLERFRERVSRFDDAPGSLAASSGIFLGSEYCFEEVRPGYALYGGNPAAGPNPMRPVVSLRARILQVRRVDSPTTVGYGASHRVGGPTRLATLGLGYADGFHRALSNRGRLFLDGVPLPVVGRVSMDLIVVDVSQLPEAKAQPGMLLDVLGPDQDIDALARDCGTIGYELLTQLGRRYHRSYAGA